MPPAGKRIAGRVSICRPAGSSCSRRRPWWRADRHRKTNMRKLTAGLFYSVDGVVEAPNLWQFDAFDDDLGNMLGQVIARTDAVIMGRVGYEEWAGYWPTAAGDEGFGDLHQQGSEVRRLAHSRPARLAGRTRR